MLLTEILFPEELLAAQAEAIRPEMVRLGADTIDLALADGVYTITIRTDAGMESLAFRADTGEAIV